MVTPVVETLLARDRGDITSASADAQIDAMSKYDIRNDLEKYFYQKSINQQYAVNFSGGSSIDAYYASIGFDKNRTNVVGLSNQRITLKIENTFSPVKNLEINGYINYIENNSSNTGYNIPTPIYPYARLADDQGNALAVPYIYRTAFVDTAKYPGLLDWHLYPLKELRNGYNNQFDKQFDIRSGARVKYNFLPELSAEVKFQYEKVLSNESITYSPESFFARNLINEYVQVDPNTGNAIYPIPIGGILDQSNSERTIWNVRSQLNFSKKWSKNQIVALTGVEKSQDNYDFYSNRLYGYNPNVHTFNTNVDYLDFYTLNASLGQQAQVPTNNNYTGILNRFLNYYANGAYTYNDKYIFSISGREDGANLFGVKTNQQIKPLWSSGVAWNISNEAFYHVNWIPLLKLRITYGYNGNINNNATAFATAQYATDPDNLTGAQYAQIVSAPNPALSWEQIRVINYGVDFEMLNQKISGTFEYYTKN
jgi:hypothetical protein